ncbi:MAG: hypothetical protein HWN81_02850 [Candidatus Lokiarchaeota archaeon]|nr:hypothetical protein [Candidatus Lokiarchaeota archaeon]
MEDAERKRDETPYIVFACKKCKQFIYVKQTQKTKKCLRCRRTHKVTDIENSGEIVNGITRAVETVKIRQHELALKELGTAPNFTAFGDYKINNSSKATRRKVENSGEENNYLSQFKEMLIDLVDLYTEVPYFAFEIFAENFNIPESELKILFRSFQKKGVIVRNNQNYMYRINLIFLT